MEKSKHLEGVEKKDLFAHGHRACGGCGQALAARLVADAAGENTIACVATGCLEVFSSPYPDPSWAWLTDEKKAFSAVAVPNKF